MSFLSMLGPIGSIANSIGKGMAPILPGLANVAGTALGSYFGGPLGGMVGGNLASTLGNAISGVIGGESPSHAPQQPQQQQMQPGQTYGGQVGGVMGNAFNQGFHQIMPPSFQNQTFGNLGQAMGDYFGQQMGHPNFGRMAGQFINPYISRMIPSGLRDQTMGNFGSNLGDRFGRAMDRGMISHGMNPYVMGSQPMNQGYAPQAPQFDNFEGPQGGGYQIPEAPPLDNFPMQRQQGFGGYDSGGMPEMTNQRGALMSDIRNFRRPSASAGIPEAPPLDMGGPSSYGIPEAPPFTAGRSSGVRSFTRPSGGSMLDEFRQRSAMSNRGLRSSQTRRPEAYPGAASNSMMDAMRQNASRIRGMVNPDDDWGYQRSGGF